MIVTCMQMAPSSGKKHSSAAEDYGLVIESYGLCNCRSGGLAPQNLYC